MKLSDIEDACKGNFVWSRNKTADKILETDPDFEVSEDTALIVVCGLADMYGFEAKEVATYLALEESEYYRLLRLYRVKMKAANERIDTKQWDIEINDLVQKVFIKTRLLQNALRMKNRDYLNMNSLPNV